LIHSWKPRNPAFVLLRHFEWMMRTGGHPLHRAGGQITAIAEMILVQLGHRACT